jgi:hypothetical protein
MTWKRGESGNISGMKKGTKHHKTRIQLSRAQKLIEAIESHENFETMLDDIKGKDLAQLYVTALEFLESRRARTEVTDSEGGPLIIHVQHSVQNPNALPPTAPEPPKEITEDTNNYQILLDEPTN